ncbi:McrC family protein [Shewanella sp. 1CM18E]|uniref:McrC family protein n=1 Tax=Shewanella sp. 1CM18E TaxID=2929169 RepID=UPI0020BDAB86|nr:McrC family protein [Shewanella sp. 1CM18E]MCK8045319.1 McrC family protein [Shewanella sp. 1CM18E]
MSNNITVFEYGFLADVAHKKASEKINWISSDAYQYLKQLCLCEQSESAFVRLRMVENTEVLQTQNYAGVILTPDGTQIEILPKIGKGNCKQKQDDARAALLLMLAALGDFRHIKTESANISQQKMPLLEVFISQFLASVNHLIKRGLRSDYSAREDNLLYLKGKLQVAKQLKHNLVIRHRFQVEFEEFLPDRAENRLVHAALLCVKKLSRSLANQRLQQELTFAFDQVPASVDHKQDFSRVRLERGMAHYESALAWAKLILNAYSPLTMKGANEATSLLFPMEAVFESYVAAELYKQITPPYQIVTQARSTHLVKHGEQNWFQLRPDIVIQKDKQHICVMDTKWKTLDDNKANGTDKYGVSQSDIYQMFAYGHNYLSGEGEMLLIYPMHEGLKEPVELPFEFTNLQGMPAQLRLWVVPFEITLQGSKLHLPRNAVANKYFL